MSTCCRVYKAKASHTHTRSGDFSILLLYCGGNGKNITRFNQNKLFWWERGREGEVRGNNCETGRNQTQLKVILDDKYKKTYQKKPENKTERNKTIEDETGRAVRERGLSKGVMGMQSPSHYFPVHQAADFCFSCRAAESSATPTSLSLRVELQHMAQS